jgi:hypothetical protein
MFSQKVITTEGSILRYSTSKNFTFLKNDPNNNFLWKSFKTKTLSNKIKNILLYKKRFLS